MSHATTARIHSEFPHKEKALPALSFHKKGENQSLKMADEALESMITEVDLDDETVARLLEEEGSNVEGENLGIQEEEEVAEHPQVNDEGMEEQSTEVTQEEDDQRDQMQEEQVEGSQEEDGDTKEETKTESGPRLFVGGLHYKTKDTDLQQHFEKYGKLKECQVARTKQRYGGDGRGRSRGYGFVTMCTQADTEVVLNDTHVINDKVVAVMVSKPRDSPERRFRISLTNLDKEKTTKESLIAHFSQYGNIVQCTISMEQVDGVTVSRGSGFITMATEEELKAALDGSVDGHQTIDEMSVEVKRAVSDGKNHERLRKLWFGGLDREKTTESDVMEYFSAFGTVKECVIVRDPPETEGGECKSKGYGFIGMTNIAEAGSILKHPEPHKIHDRLLAFNRTLQKPGQPDAENPSDKLVTVSGLKETPLTLDDLMAYFKSHAKFRFITMEKSDGTAIVALDKVEDAEKLAQIRDHCIQKYWLTVEKTSLKTIKMEKAKNKTNNAGKNANKSKGAPIANPKRLKDIHTSPMPARNAKGKGSVRGRPNDRRQGGFGKMPSRNQAQHYDDGYYNGPGRQGGSGFGGGMMSGGFISQGQTSLMDDYYGSTASSYGPVKGGGGGPRGRVQNYGQGSKGDGGGWVFVENLYGQQEGRFSDTNMNQRQMKGFRNKRQQNASMDLGGGGYGNPMGQQMGNQSGMGGGYNDNWGKGNAMNRNKRRGKGRPY